MAIHLQRGQHAESLALKYLISQGLTLIEKNYRCHFGEIDLIMHEKPTSLVFVEVRFRKKDNINDALESITPIKMLKLQRAAHFFLLIKGKDYQRHDLRFDVIALNRLFKMGWIKNAFEVQ